VSTRDFTRTGCTVGARLVTYEQLTKGYVCNICGGAIVHKIARENGETVDWAECGHCHKRDFVREWLYEKQVAEFPVLVYELPTELRNLIKPPQNLTFEQATEDLFG